MRKRKWKVNLSVIEVVEIVAIMGVLAAVLCPVFKTARMNNKMGLCASNHKQLAAAFEQYVEEWDGMICTAITMRSFGGDWNSATTFWPEKLEPYIHSERVVYYCAEVPLPPDADIDGPGSYWWKYFPTIGINILVGGDSTMVQPPIHMSQIGTPSGTILFGCSSMYPSYSKIFPGYPADSGYYIICPGSKSSPLLARNCPRLYSPYWPYHFFDPARHDGHVVITHMDGHVSVYTIEELLTPKYSDITNMKDPRLKEPDFSLWDNY